MVQTASSGRGDSWHVHQDPTAVAAALDSKGLCEGILKKSMAAAFPCQGSAGNPSGSSLLFTTVLLNRKPTRDNCNAYIDRNDWRCCLCLAYMESSLLWLLHKHCSCLVMATYS